jgi:serine/threonine protein kinase
MATDSHLRVQGILDAAMRLPAADRAEFIERACGTDATLLDEVRSLLPHYQQTLDFEPARGPEWFLPGTTTIAKARADAATAEDDPEPPFCIDQYRCEQVLGRGGMGIVYRATHATLRRPFAIKLLRRGLLCSENRWRFAFESELLRRLQHPGIARVYHVNEVRSASGIQPYFVMEYIRGQSLVRYADTKGLNVLERLWLLTKVCEAVEYAHRRGIIHRDLKPGNILVDDAGQPRILDFGIARIEEFTPATGADRPGGFVGTYEYASPEQKAGRNDRLTPSCDVYALGLITHELLTGRLPTIIDGRLRLDVERIRLAGCSRAAAARRKEFHYFLRLILSSALARTTGKRYRSAGRLGAALAALAAEFDKPSVWSALRSRLARFWSSRSTAAAGHTYRPLNAVLRTRIGMSLESDRAERLGDRGAAGSPPDEEADREVYRVRESGVQEPDTGQRLNPP